ncbi:MGH1-like glycoside hydrolase domain-containing protein [Anaeromyxobacter oryzae]|uniref:Glucosidase n=1 Tax=Anaeromyxobacter oryzae TaxID=2918170 RepID=A0ABN6MY91_9BACT|nr:glucosidase [Anaeromyxobacter oryzae]BDG04769.1 glucosidase [Anaeromyxobacter oryzae]
MSAERERLRDADEGRQPWRRWGPYLAERQWGTVREDYSAGGTPWVYFPHEHARSRAYRWGEDGLLGICDDEGLLCFAPALWNGRDPILKERLFGLAGPEGNHGEDVKEEYHYLDAVPSSSYLKALYRYPFSDFPYQALRDESRRRGRDVPELELRDTGVFAGGWVDFFVEYAKAEPEDLLIRLTAVSRAPGPAVLHVLPHLWFRNTWSWGRWPERPRIALLGAGLAKADHSRLGVLYLQWQEAPELLVSDNDTNFARLYGHPPSGAVKDAFHDAVVRGRRDGLREDGEGTKLALWHSVSLPPGGAKVIRLRLRRDPAPLPFADFDRIFAAREREAEEFWRESAAGIEDPEARRVHRQALAGLLWSRQFYHWDVPRWLEGDPGQPVPPAERRRGRDSGWEHLNNADVLLVPDKWEYPWYAAWDLAFHCVAVARVDPELAKAQLVLLLREWYMHPNGQLPAFEWNLGAANPPVHAWAAWRVFEIDRELRGGRGDRAFLERVFHKLLINFTWWVNRKDVEGRNVFQGGFLGLDNIGVFDRSEMAPDGALDQADGTSWMAMYALDLLRIALELAREEPIYQDVATKFFEHFLYIADAMNDVGRQGVALWDPEDEFFYDVLRRSDGRAVPLKIRSLVGLIPLFAVEVLESEQLARVPEFAERLRWFLRYRPDLASLVSRWHVPGAGDTRLLALLRGHRMKRVLRRMLDEAEFLSPFGVRSLSRHHREAPFRLALDGTFTVDYEPGEARTGLFGGNSNWRGPVWVPMNYLIVEALRRFHRYYGDDFRVECPTGSGVPLSLAEIADEIAGRVLRLFLPGPDGRRPYQGSGPALPGSEDLLLFHEYFDGEDGRGLGASHQTGWTALAAELLRTEARARRRSRTARHER